VAKDRPRRAGLRGDPFEFARDVGAEPAARHEVGCGKRQALRLQPVDEACLVRRIEAEPARGHVEDVAVAGRGVGQTAPELRRRLDQRQIETGPRFAQEMEGHGRAAEAPADDRDGQPPAWIC